MIKTFGRVNALFTNFVRILLVLAIITSYIKSRTLISIFLAITFFATYIPYFMKKFFHIKTRAEPQLIMLIIIYGILYLSEVRRLFDGDWWNILLTFGAAIILGFIGLTIIYVLYQERIINTSPLMLVVLSFSISFAVGGLWEILEYVLDINLGFSLKKLGTGDTMKDLIVYAIGAFAIAIGGHIYMRYSKKNVLSSIIVKFMHKNPKLFKSNKYLENPVEEITSLVKKGEDPRLEFKSTLRTNLHTGEKDKDIELSVLKTIVAYLNTEGGTLLIGVSDKGEITGLEKDAFENNDKLKLHLTNLIKQHIGRQFFSFLQYELFPVEDKHVLKIDCLPSNKRVFLKDGKEEDFFIRNGPSTSRLSGNALIDYINHRFKEN